jgi:hypothetical protein
MKELLQLWFGMSDIFNDDEVRAQDPRLWWLKAMRSIVYCIVVLAIAGVVVYRIATTPLNIAQLDFSQLLSLILALFSMGLSATFYFKATDTSNKFYDRTFGHTKELIKALVRIEERFGEQLRHIERDTRETWQISQSKNEDKEVIKTTANETVSTVTTTETETNTSGGETGGAGR